MKPYGGQALGRWLCVLCVLSAACSRGTSQPEPLRSEVTPGELEPAGSNARSAALAAGAFAAAAAGGVAAEEDVNSVSVATELQMHGEQPEAAPTVDFTKRLSAPLFPEQLLGFTRERLAHLRRDGLHVHSLPDFKESFSITLSGSLTLLPILGGDFLVARRESTERLSKTGRELRSFARIPLLVGAEVIADAGDPLRFMVRYPNLASLFDYELGVSDGPLVPFSELLLEGYDGRAAARLRGGKWLYTAGDELRFRQSKQQTTSVSAQPFVGETPWQLLPAQALEQAFLVTAEGGVWWLDASARALPRLLLRAEFTPITAASSGTLLGLVAVEQPRDAPRRWSVRVLDERGAERFEAELPLWPEGERTMATELDNRSLALSADGRFLAVGGRTWLRVYNLAQRELVFSEPPEMPRAEAPASQAAH